MLVDPLTKVYIDAEIISEDNYHNDNVRYSHDCKIMSEGYFHDNGCDC